MDEAPAKHATTCQATLSLFKTSGDVLREPTP